MKQVKPNEIKVIGDKIYTGGQYLPEEKKDEKKKESIKKEVKNG